MFVCVCDTLIKVVKMVWELKKFHHFVKKTPIPIYLIKADSPKYIHICEWVYRIK